MRIKPLKDESQLSWEFRGIAGLKGEEKFQRLLSLRKELSELEKYLATHWDIPLNKFKNLPKLIASIDGVLHRVRRGK